jgi:hypothetical protein
VVGLSGVLSLISLAVTGISGAVGITSYSNMQMKAMDTLGRPLGLSETLPGAVTGISSMLPFLLLAFMGMRNRSSSSKDDTTIVVVEDDN